MLSRRHYPHARTSYVVHANLETLGSREICPAPVLLTFFKDLLKLTSLSACREIA